MGVINQLSFEVANLIAAGEVVDRPASAIKELMENSIDAGAKHITVETKNGGVTFIRVSDDGCGMEPEDLPMAIRRHATSKISSAEDLDGICTLGFRGEALAAISAVSKMRIISKKPQNTMGAVLDIECGEILGLNEQGCSNGTTIIAEELFANVPARRKFLKRDVTETSFICTNVEKVALSHPEISIRLICDGQIRLESAGDGNLKNAIYSIFGRDFASKLIEVYSDYDGITVRGFIGRSDNVKGNRGAQNFYINNRYVKSKTATAALEQAYSSYMPSERFPVCVLFIDMSPGRVDVNVHPAKLEVKFSNEKPVFEAVYYAVKQALESDSTRPQMQTKKPSALLYSQMQTSVEKSPAEKPQQLSIDTPIRQNTENNGGFEKITAKEYISKYAGGPPPKNANTDESKKIAKSYDIPPSFAKDNKPEETKRSSGVKQASDIYAENATVNMPTNDNATVEGMPLTCANKAFDNAPKMHTQSIVAEQKETFEMSNPSAEANKPSETAKLTAEPNKTSDNQNEPQRNNSVWRFVGEVFNSYLICEVDDKLLLIDKHAAHERIIYEQLKANMYKQETCSQLLMMPIEVMLMSDEIVCLEEYRQELESIGFGFTSAKNTVFVNEIPSGIDSTDVPLMLATFADRLKNGTGNIQITRNIIFEKALYQASCKAAIKAGREYAREHHEWIIKKLMEIPDITVCPHGRPVAMELSHKNIDRQFERT